MADKGAVHHQGVFFQVFQQLREVSTKSIVQGSSQLVKLRESACVELAPVVFNHQLVKTPKDVFFIVDVNQHDCNYVVKALNISNVFVIVSISLENIEKFVVSTKLVFIPKTQISHRPIYILFDLIADGVVWNLT